MSEYTPDLSDAQSYYVSGRAQLRRHITGEQAIDITEYSHEFDRWLADVERAAAEKARGEALIEAVQAHRNLHRAYASTSVCRGGIGGQAITSHCGEVCDNYEAHEKDTEAWTELEVEAIEYSCARAEAEWLEGQGVGKY